MPGKHYLCESVLLHDILLTCSLLQRHNHTHTQGEIQGHRSQGHPPNTHTHADWNVSSNDSSTRRSRDLFVFPFLLPLSFSSPPLFTYCPITLPPFLPLSHFDFARLSSRLCASGSTKRTATEQRSPVTGAYHDE